MKIFRTALYASVLTMAAPAIAHEGQPNTSVPAPKPAAAPIASTAPHHSGGTDANGCHTNHATGEYHCHKPK